MTLTDTLIACEDFLWIRSLGNVLSSSTFYLVWDTEFMVVSPSFSMSATFQLNAIGRGFALIDIVGTINKMFRGFGKKKKFLICGFILKILKL